MPFPSLLVSYSFIFQHGHFTRLYLERLRSHSNYHSTQDISNNTLAQILAAENTFIPGQASSSWHLANRSCLTRFPNTIEFVIAFFAVSLQRAVASPLNPAYKEEEFKFYLEDLNAVLLLVPREESKQKDEAVRAARACGTSIAEVHYDGEKMVIEVVNRGDIEGRQPASVEKPQNDDIALILRKLLRPRNLIQC